MTCKGLYALGQPNRPIPQAILFADYVDCIVLRQTWLDFTINPNYLNDWIPICKMHGKRYALCMIPGQWSDPSIYPSCKAFPFKRPDGKSAVCPVPWDWHYRKAWGNLQKILARSYGMDASLDHVKVPLLCGLTEEEFLPHSPKDTALWLSSGYRPSLAIQAYDQWVIEMRNVWPGKPLIAQYVPFGWPGIDENGNVLSQPSNEVGSEILSRMSMVPQCGAQNNGISPTFFSKAVAALYGHAYVGGQFVEAFSNPDAYGQSFDQAKAGNCSWVEAYIDDLTDPALIDTSRRYHALFNA